MSKNVALGSEWVSGWEAGHRFVCPRVDRARRHAAAVFAADAAGP